ncbi:spore germination protein [Sporosarcina sp. OR05]|uniref:spore germination protein n=1 Tax=Sporosarcina sp. OR05 TaxID=2969819 RepID=UPI00352B1857
MNSNHDEQAPILVQRLAHHLQPSADIIQTPLHIDGTKAHVLYLKSVVDGQLLQTIVIKPFFELRAADSFVQYLSSLPNKVDVPAERQLLIELTKGNVLVVVGQRTFLLDIKKSVTNTVLETALEPTIHGPQFGLSESLETNLNIIRHRYYTSSLVVETASLNDESNRPIAILYDEKHVDTHVLDLVKERLKDLKNPLIQSTGDLELYLNNQKLTLFPDTLLTERPDRIAYNLATGKVVLLVDGSPQATMAPAVFFDFMVSMEDHYHSFWISLSTLMLRYAGLLTCIILPALYVAIISFNPDVIRTELALTVAGSRIGVPYPSYIEVLFMLVFIELLTEASIRLPKAVSATATTVGGLILGTAVVEAALASNIMIIVVSLVAISTFVIPINEMSFSIRISRFFLLLYASLFGLAGVIIGMLGIMMYLTNKESFGKPYLKMYWKNRNDELKVKADE